MNEEKQKQTIGIGWRTGGSIDYPRMIITATPIPHSNKNEVIEVIFSFLNIIMLVNARAYRVNA